MNTPQLRCPSCGLRFAADAHSVYRPFCSERCRLVDLHGWMSERHRITDKPAAETALSSDPDDPLAGDFSQH